MTRQLFSLAVVAVLVLWLLPPGARAAASSPAASNAEPDAKSRVERLDWVDPRRQRTVPVLIRFPAKEHDSPVPVVLVSHGLGGTRDGLSYVGEHWAANGYLVVHLQHHGSDSSVWEGVPRRERMRAMQQATRRPGAALDRAHDVRFVIDKLMAERALQSDLGRLVDPERIGIAGHSYGAWTVLASTGLSMGGRNGMKVADARLKVGIPMSSPFNARNDASNYAAITVPTLHITGTRDTGGELNPGLTPEMRTMPYQLSPAGAQHLVVLEDADHMVFAGREAGMMGERNQPRDARHHAVIRRITLDFLDAYLKANDPAAIAAFREAKLREGVGDEGVVQVK